MNARRGLHRDRGQDHRLLLAAGARKVDAAERHQRARLCHDPDRDPYENAFANLKVVANAWNGETITLAGCMSQGKRALRRLPRRAGPLRQRPQHADAHRRATSLLPMTYAPWWISRITVGEGRDELQIEGYQPGALRDAAGPGRRGRTSSASPRARSSPASRRCARRCSPTPHSRRPRRDTNSGLRVASTRPGGAIASRPRCAATTTTSSARATPAPSARASAGPASASSPPPSGRGFRAPTFFDLYAPVVGLLRAQPGPSPRAERKPRALGPRGAHRGLAVAPHRVRQPASRTSSPTSTPRCRT